jgi:hypothetical protein
MPQSFHIENESFLEIRGDDVDIQHCSNDTQSMEVGGDIHSIHSSDGGVKNMEFGGRLWWH